MALVLRPEDDIPGGPYSQGRRRAVTPLIAGVNQGCFMIGEEVERRPAAVLAADVAGYSLLMGADEVGTLATLKAHRREIVDPSITARRERIFETTGDGMLAEFPSVVEE